MKESKLLQVFFIACVFWGCSSGDTHRLAVDRTIDLQFCRLDQGLFGGELKVPDCQLGRVFFEDIIGVGSPESELFLENLKMFTDNPNWALVQQDIDTSFGDLRREIELLNTFFSGYSSVFGSGNIPDVAFYNGGYSYGVYPDSAFLGIGLEWFVGPHSPIINMLNPEQFPRYRKRKMVKEQLVPQACLGYLMFHHLQIEREAHFLDHLVAHGKVVYLAQLMLPEMELDQWLGYAQDQMEWMTRNEYALWKEWVKQDLLFAKKVDDFRKYFIDGPFTNGLPDESPSKIGYFMGYKMVLDFMIENPEITIEKMLETPAAQILKTYNPKH